jgi:hypothetical protein
MCAATVPLKVKAKIGGGRANEKQETITHLFEKILTLKCGPSP